MGAVLNFKLKPVPAKMQCTGCGATANAACDCNVAYVPVRERAAKAIAANPTKSDRAIAKELGVSNFSVSEARKKSTVRCLTVELRVGLDGKKRRLPKLTKTIGCLLLSFTCMIQGQASFAGPQ